MDICGLDFPLENFCIWKALRNWNPLYLFPFLERTPLSAHRLLIRWESVVLKSLAIFLQLFKHLLVGRWFDENDLAFDEFFNVIQLEGTKISLMFLHFIDPVSTLKITPKRTALISALISTLISPPIVIIGVTPSIVVVFISPSIVAVIVVVISPAIVVIVTTPSVIVLVTKIDIIEELSTSSSPAFGLLFDLCKRIKVPHVFEVCLKFNI